MGTKNENASSNIGYYKKKKKQRNPVEEIAIYVCMKQN